MSGKGLAGPVSELLAGLQVQILDVVAVLGEGGEGRVPHSLEQRDHQLVALLLHPTFWTIGMVVYTISDTQGSVY